MNIEHTLPKAKTKSELADLFDRTLARCPLIYLPKIEGGYLALFNQYVGAKEAPEVKSLVFIRENYPRMVHLSTTGDYHSHDLARLIFRVEATPELKDLLESKYGCKEAWFGNSYLQRNTLIGPDLVETNFSIVYDKAKDVLEFSLYGYNPKDDTQALDVIKKELTELDDEQLV